MTDVDPRDAQLVREITAAIGALIRATHQDDALEMIGGLNLLLDALIAHKRAMGEPPGAAAALLRAERPADAAVLRATRL